MWASLAMLHQPALLSQCCTGPPYLCKQPICSLMALMHSLNDVPACESGGGGPRKLVAVEKQYRAIVVGSRSFFCTPPTITPARARRVIPPTRGSRRVPRSHSRSNTTLSEMSTRYEHGLIISRYRKMPFVRSGAIAVFDLRATDRKFRCSHRFSSLGSDTRRCVATGPSQRGHPDCAVP